MAIRLAKNASIRLQDFPGVLVQKILVVPVVEPSNFMVKGERMYGGTVNGVLKGAVYFA